MSRWGRTAAQLTDLEPTGEVGRIEVESDTGRGKAFNGMQPWPELPYLWATPGDVRTESLDLADSTGSTGVVTGGLITINADPTKIDISAGSGYVIDDTVNPPTVAVVTWDAFTAVTLTDLATQSATDIAINAAGALVQQRSYTNSELRSVLFLGGIDHSGGVVNNVFSIQVPAFAAALSVRDLARAVGDLNLSGNDFGAASTNLTIAKSAGTSFSFGRNTTTDKTNPHVIAQGALSPVSFNYISRNGTGGTTVSASNTDVNPLNFDDGSGTLATVGVNDYALQQFLLFSNSSRVFVQYGATTYNTMQRAVEGLSATTFPVLPGFASAMRRGVLIVKRGTTNLATAADAKFFVADKFGSIAGATGSGATAYAAEVHTHGSSDITDFAAAVEANASVTANTAKETNATHTGDVTGATALTIANDAVTNAKLANMAEATIKGREAAAGTGDPADLTAAQARTILNVADGATANASDASLRDRATHTGTQAVGTITGLATVATTGAYADLGGIPSTFTPSSHTHVIADTTGLQTALDAKAALPTLARRRREYSDFLNTGTGQNLPFVGAAISGGGGGTSVNLAGDFGVLRLNSAAGGNTGYRWQTITGLQASTGLFFRGIIGWTGTFDANVVCRMGYHDSTTSAEPVDGIYMQSAGDQVVLRCAAASSRTSSATAWTVPALNTLYIIEIEQTSGTAAAMTVRDLSGTLLFSETVTSNVPAGTGQIFVAGLTAHHAAAGARNLILLDYMEVATAKEVYA